MDERSSKRQKLSPARPASRDGLRNPPRRASFMSPTKASLARFNPNLLNQTANKSPSRPSQGSASSVPSRRQDLRSYILSTAPETNNESPVAQAIGRKERAASTEQENPSQAIKDARSAVELEKSTLSRPQPLTPSVRSNVLPEAEPVEEEAELPATPQGLENVEYDPPPRGILFSSPSKRPRRSKSLAQKLKSSPLKPVEQAATAPEEDDSRQDSPTKTIPLDSQNVDVVQLADPVTQDLQPKERTDETSDQMNSKIRKRDKLKEELKHLTEDVESLENMILALDNSKSNQDVNLEDLMGLIGAEYFSTNDPSTKPLPISQALLSFGPFSNFVQATPNPTEQDEDIPSHRPIKLDDPLPHLRVFTPFTFSSEISTLPSDSSGAICLKQAHKIRVHGPRQLFHAAVQMTVDTEHECISDLSVSSLPAWTDAELGAWIRTPSQRGGPTKNDVSSICWAMGSYWELAVKRAQCWIRCQDAFPHLLPDLSVDTDAEIEKVAVVESDDESDPEAEPGPKQPDVHSLRPHLGRRSLILQKDEVLLEVRWVIGFDWTGEAESEVSIDYGCPGSWHEVDDRKSLKKIPDTFQNLVKSKGVFEAIRVMAALLFPKISGS